MKAKKHLQSQVRLWEGFLQKAEYSPWLWNPGGTAETETESSLCMGILGHCDSKLSAGTSRWTDPWTQELPWGGGNSASCLSLLGIVLQGFKSPVLCFTFL
jgi:hypothetical protein